MENAVKDWFLQTEADLDSAEYNLAGGKYYAAVIFAQQAAEKALKAVYILKS